MRSRFRLGTAALLLAAAFSGACTEQTTAAQVPAPAVNPDQVVAEVAGKAITLKEVDAKWEEFDAAERARVIQAMYQSRRNMIEVLVGDQLIASAAKAAGQEVDAYVEKESARLLPAIGEKEIAAFYEQNKDRAQGRTLDDLRTQIKDFLEAQRKLQTRAQLVEELKAASGGGVRVLLDPPRHTVALLEHDPIRGESTAPITVVEFSDYQ